MFSLFSSFDYFFFKFPILSEFFFLMIFMNFCFKKNFMVAIFLIFKSFMFKFFNSLSTKGCSKSLMNFLLVMMVFIMLSNFFSVFPFTFPHMSQMSKVFWVGLSVWLGLMIFFLCNNSVGFISHSVPEGSPLILSPPLFLIELVSSAIRPLTLTVRLVANILAGHLLMILLSKVVHEFFYFFIFFLVLNMVEFFVALIQAYIFVAMTMLYYCDVS